MLRDSAPATLRERIAGELLTRRSRSPRPRTLHFGQAAKQLLLNRAELFAHADEQGYALGSTGTHPFSGWKDQQIIDTPHYRLVEDRLKYVAWRNKPGRRTCTSGSAAATRRWRSATRCARTCRTCSRCPPTRLHRGRLDALHSARTQTFVRMFPRCGIPDVFGTWAAHRGFYQELVDTNCIQEFTQIWWSVRPHHRFGTVEVRICDAQTEAWQSLAISSLTVGLIAHLGRVYDEGMPLPILETRYIEENLWRAIRYGLDGKLVDWVMGEELPATDAVRHLVELRGATADAIGLSPHLADVDVCCATATAPSSRLGSRRGRGPARGVRRHGRRRPPQLDRKTADGRESRR